MLSDLPWAIYYFVETKAPEGYKLNSTPIRFEVERETFSNGETTVNVSAENEKYYADVKLKKVFKKLNEESAGNLEALFDLYKVESGKEDILIASNLKSEEGVVKYSGLGTGSYYFIETSAPDGYSIELVNGQPKKYTFTVTVPDNNERVTVDAGMAVNTRNPGTVEIEKLNESYQNTPMSNVTFKLYRVDSIVTETELEPIITGNDGTGRQSGLEWGSYYLQEVTPEGYIVNNHKYDFTISADNLTASFTGDKAIKNSVITGNVVLNKKDKTSGADLSGVEFELYRGTSPDGVLVQTDKALVTDSKGQITLNGLEYGSYYFKEKTAKQGYQLSDTVIPFTINENGKTVTVAAENERLLGSVVITKQDELTGSVLAGAEFTLYSQTDRREMNPIMKALTGMNDDYHVYREGLKTDADGILKIENLPWDNYYLIETKAPQGYTLDSNTRYAFTIDAGKLTGQLNGKTENIITNKKQTGSVTLTKMDADDQGKLLSGAEFELYRRLEDGTAEKVELEHTLLTTDESGSITVKDLDWGKYYFKEIKAPVGYALNPTETEFEITRENVAASIETPIAVTVKDTAFEISVDKVDAETNTSLTGAELKLYHLEDVVAGKPAEDAKPIAVWNSVAGSPQKIGMLINGGSAYVLIETKAPAGYTLAENLIFTVREDGTIETDGTVTDSNIILVQDVKYVPGTLTLTAGKELTGRTLTEGEFEFALKEGDNTIATAVNQADGSINFNLTNYYAETGEHDYTVVEIDNGLSGITYDKTSYAVHVSVKDNNNGGLAAEITYPDGSDGIVFKNVYHATGSLNVTGIKEINGREFKAGDEYTFELLRDKKVVDTITIRPTAGNQAGFVLRDSSLDESDSKMTYSYEVREVLGGQTVSGVTYDGTVYKGDYRINDNGDGTVRADRVNGSDLAEVRFTNTYRTGEAAFTINGIKHMTGRSFRAGDEFTFIAEKDGQPYDTVTIRPESENDAQFAMKTDVYTKADAGKTYTYTVYEQKGTISRVTYSDAVYKIHVSITDDGEGNLNAAAVIDGKAFTTVEFINSYDATSDGDHTGGDGGHNPDSNKPYVPGGPGDLVTVTPDEVPLATAPTGGSPTDDLILIDDGNVPLAGLPKTGDRAAHAGLAAFLSGILLAAFAAIGGRKKEEEDR